MDEIIHLLNTLGVLDSIEQTFNINNIPFNEDNLIRVAIGFGLINTVSPLSVVLNQKIVNFISTIQIKQKVSNFEQAFALIGKVQVDNNGNFTIFVDEFIENSDGLSSEISGSWGKSSFQRVINKVVEPTEELKVILLCHTHPNMKTIESDNYANIRDAIENMANNPLQLRERGLNPSLGDIRQLLSLNHYFPGVMKFIGILLPNGEINFLSYNGEMLQQISSVLAKTNSGTYPLPTFTTNNVLSEKDSIKK